MDRDTLDRWKQHAVADASKRKKSQTKVPSMYDLVNGMRNFNSSDVLMESYSESVSKIEPVVKRWTDSLVTNIPRDERGELTAKMALGHEIIASWEHAMKQDEIDLTDVLKERDVDKRIRMLVEQMIREWAEDRARDSANRFGHRTNDITYAAVMETDKDELRQLLNKLYKKHLKSFGTTHSSKDNALKRKAQIAATKEIDAEIKKRQAAIIDDPGLEFIDDLIDELVMTFKKDADDPWLSSDEPEPFNAKTFLEPDEKDSNDDWRSRASRSISQAKDKRDLESLPSSLPKRKGLFSR